MTYQERLFQSPIRGKIEKYQDPVEYNWEFQSPIRGKVVLMKIRRDVLSLMFGFNPL